MEDHHASLDALKQALRTALVLSYLDFSKDFVLETDALLKGLGAILPKVGGDWKTHVIANASRSLCPSERSIWNYSSAKLQLLALKSRRKKVTPGLSAGFNVYTDNNPLAYVQERRLDTCEIRWLSKVALFNFQICYQFGSHIGLLIP